MPEPEDAADAKSSATGNTDRRIVREPGFTRAVVDDIVPIVLGRDVELSCLQFSPVLNGMVDKGDHYLQQIEPVYVEVARIRLTWRDAVDLGMQLLHKGIIRDVVKGNAVAEQIAKWAAEHEAKAQDTDQNQTNEQA